MPALTHVKVSFRLSGDDLDPSEVSRLLGVEPSLVYARGDTYSPGTAGRAYTRHFGMWSLKSDVEEGAELETHLVSPLDRLPPEALLLLVQRGYRTDFFCGLFLDHHNEGVGLSPATLGRIARLGAKLELDIYSMPNDEDDEQSVAVD
jgi:hypothetical protein